MHPDKNPALAATDAFKKVNAAMACLSDPEKRYTYDKCGNASSYEQQESRSGMHPEFKSFEDLFNYLYYGQNIPPDKPPMHKILP